MRRFTDVVTPEEPVQEKGEGGTTTTRYEEHSPVWVDIEPMSGSDYWQSQQQQDAVTYRVTGRAMALRDIREGWRLTRDGQVLTVRDALMRYTRDRHAELICTEER